MKRLFSVLLIITMLTFAAYAQTPQANGAPVAVAPQYKPKVFVTDEPMHEGSIIVRDRAAAGHVESGPNPRVVEIQSDLVKVCPKVTVTNRRDLADFTLLFRRQGGTRSAMFAFGGLAGLALSAASKVDGASLFSSNGDLVTATKQRTVEKAIVEVCAAIPEMTGPAPVQPALPAPGAAEAAPAPQPVPQMVTAAALELTVVSDPDGADVEVDGAFVGGAPLVIPTTVGDHVVHVTKKGFKPYDRKLHIAGGSVRLVAELDPV